MKIAALILTYNRREILQECVDAVLHQQSDCRPDIIVIDNGSSDGTSDLFLPLNAPYHQKRIHYYNSGMNTGCAGGFCLGIRKAAELGYDHIWMMDDDCIPSEAALGELVRYAEAHMEEYGFLSSKVLWKDGSICEMNLQRGTVFRPLKSMTGDAIPVKMASFASLFIPMKVIRDVGLPYKEFFIWTDDWEYTRRISKKYACYLIPRSEMTHYIKSGSKADIAAAAPERLERFYYLYRNDVFLYRREGLKGFAYEAARIPAHLLRIAFSDHDMKEKIKRANIVVKGTTEGLSFYPEPERLPAEGKAQD